jgi:hypothetical protein
LPAAVCCQVLELDLKLHPSNIRKLKDIKPPKQQQHKSQNGKQQQDKQQPQSQLQRALSHPLLSQPSLRHFLQDRRSGAGAAGQQQQQPKQQVQELQASSSSVPELGTVRVALWWSPTWRHHHAFDVAERVSFCLLPGELKVWCVADHHEHFVTNIPIAVVWCAAVGRSCSSKHQQVHAHSLL